MEKMVPTVASDEIRKFGYQQDVAEQYPGHSEEEGEDEVRRLSPMIVRGPARSELCVRLSIVPIGIISNILLIDVESSGANWAHALVSTADLGHQMEANEHVESKSAREEKARQQPVSQFGRRGIKISRRKC